MYVNRFIRFIDADADIDLSPPPPCHFSARSASYGQVVTLAVDFNYSILIKDGADPPPPRNRAELNANRDYHAAPPTDAGAVFDHRRTRRELDTESAVAAATRAEAAAAESARREEQQRREERERRLRVTEMLFELKQDAEAQGEDLRRHLNQAQAKDPRGKR